jgi:hypothetical protein
MKKGLLIGLAVLFLIGSTIGAYAWWDRLQQTADDQTLEITYGVRLVLTDQTASPQGELVPSGSFFAGTPGYTTSYEFVYELKLEADMGTFDLEIDITDLEIGEVSYLKASTHKALNVVVTTSSGEFISSEDSSVELSVHTTALRINNVLEGTDAITISVTFTLAAHDSELLVATDYANVAGKSVEFDIAFNIPVYADQSANQG